MKRTPILLMAATLMLAGCGGSGAADSQSSSAMITSAEKEEADLSIGKDETGSQSAVVENATGKKITGIALRKTGEKDFQPLMETDTLWESGQKAEIFYQPIEQAQPSKTGESEKSEEGERPEIAINDQYEMRVAFEDGKEQTLQLMPFEDIASDGKLELKDDVLFVSYTAKNGDTVSTFEAQKAAADEAKKQAEEEQKKAEEEKKRAEEEAAAAQAAQEQAAQQQIVEEQPVYQEPVYEEPVYQEPVYQDPGVQQTPDVGGQDASGCLNLDDLGL